MLTQAQRRKRSNLMQLAEMDRTKRVSVDVVLSRSALNRFRDVRARIDFIVSKLDSIETRSWFDALTSCGWPYRWAEWRERIVGLAKGAPTEAKYGWQLRAAEESLRALEDHIREFANRNKYRDPSYKHTLCDELRNARSAPERRRIMERLATPIWVDTKDLERVYLERLLIERAAGVEHDVDHIVPIMHRKVCGLHVPWNLRVIPRTDNQRKSNKFYVT